MSQEKKRLTNMVWRSMAEQIVLACLMLAAIVYYLFYYEMINPFESWGDAIKGIGTLLGAVALVGGVFGYWQTSQNKRRIEQLRDVMLFWERGNLSRSVPPLGDDEIGQLGEQLGRIGNKWEEQVTTLQRLSSDNAELAERAKLSAVVEERQRLARELHDAVSQQLFAISMTATAVSRTLDKDFEKAKRQVSLIEEMAAVAQSEMRALLLHLRPVHLEGKRLSEGLGELIVELQAKVPIGIDFEMNEDVRLAKGIEDHLFRIVQEALSNTLRHSRATRMEIRLHQRLDSVRLLIRDNGIGFDLEVKKHASYGIVSMQERVTEVGGTMNIITAPGNGTRIEIRVPIMTEGELSHVSGTHH